MARFYVGQRVRIVKTYIWPELLGTEATILGGEEHVKNTVTGKEWFGYRIGPDVWGGSNIFPNGNFLCARGECLEPITDANDLVTWESMRDLWVPEHLRTNA